MGITAFMAITGKITKGGGKNTISGEKGCDGRTEESCKKKVM